jgi:hypothetical protein
MLPRLGRSSAAVAAPDAGGRSVGYESGAGGCAASHQCALARDEQHRGCGGVSPMPRRISPSLRVLVTDLVTRSAEAVGDLQAAHMLAAARHVSTPRVHAPALMVSATPAMLRTSEAIATGGGSWRMLTTEDMTRVLQPSPAE